MKLKQIIPSRIFIGLLTIFVLYLLKLKLFGGTVPSAKKLFGGTVPPAKKLFGGTVRPAKKLFGGTVPPTKKLFEGTVHYTWCSNRKLTR